MLIGLCGKAGAGKDTVFARAVEMAERMGLPRPERIAFADKLKQSAALLLDISVDDLNSYKTSSSGGHLTVLGKPMSMRLFLQRYGTEAHRDVFGFDFWVDAALPFGFDHSDRIVFITDVRFSNESERVRLLGGKVVNVLGVDSEISAGAAGHASEDGIYDVDHTIDNTSRGSFGELDRQVRSLMADYWPHYSVAETGDPKDVTIAT